MCSLGWGLIYGSPVRTPQGTQVKDVEIIEIYSSLERDHTASFLFLTSTHIWLIKKNTINDPNMMITMIANNNNMMK